jgi:hypothetical protein
MFYWRQNHLPIDFKKEGVPQKAPQKQCKDKTPHKAHHYERPGGLINWCQGRSR